MFSFSISPNSKWLRYLFLLILVYFFLVSISIMGLVFKTVGKEMASTLIASVSIPIIALFVGILATSIMQSSSATTSIIVGLVASGILDLRISIPMLMGANIGTSVTSTLTSMAHITNRKEFGNAFSGAVIHDFFNISAVAILFPIEIFFHIIENSVNVLSQSFVGVSGVALFSPVGVFVKPVANFVAGFFGTNYILLLLFSLAILFGCLRLIVNDMKSVASDQMKNVNSKFFKNIKRSFLTGMGLTVLVQSSSITTSMAVPFIGTGHIKLDKIFPFILGANIGTTITAFLAALAIGTPLALSVALAHLLFNIFGIVVIYPLKKVPLFFAKNAGAIAERYRRFALGYTVTFFFVLPGAVIFFI